MKDRFISQLHLTDENLIKAQEEIDIAKTLHEQGLSAGRDEHVKKAVGLVGKDIVRALARGEVVSANITTETDADGHKITTANARAAIISKLPPSNIGPDYRKAKALTSQGQYHKDPQMLREATEIKANGLITTIQTIGKGFKKVITITQELYKLGEARRKARADRLREEQEMLSPVIDNLKGSSKTVELPPKVRNKAKKAADREFDEKMENENRVHRGLTIKGNRDSGNYVITLKDPEGQPPWNTE